MRVQSKDISVKAVQSHDGKAHDNLDKIMMDTPPDTLWQGIYALMHKHKKNYRKMMQLTGVTTIYPGNHKKPDGECVAPSKKSVIKIFHSFNEDPEQLASYIEEANLIKENFPLDKEKPSLDDKNKTNGFTIISAQKYKQPNMFLQPTAEDVWDVIDDIAEKHNMTPSGLAKKTGLDPSALNKSKRISATGQSHWISLPTVIKIFLVAGEDLTTFPKLLIDKTAENNKKKLIQQRTCEPMFYKPPAWLLSDDLQNKLEPHVEIIDVKNENPSNSQNKKIILFDSDVPRKYKGQSKYRNIECVTMYHNTEGKIVAGTYLVDESKVEQIEKQKPNIVRRGYTTGHTAGTMKMEDMKGQLWEKPEQVEKKFNFLVKKHIKYLLPNPQMAATAKPDDRTEQIVVAAMKKPAQHKHISQAAPNYRPLERFPDRIAEDDVLYAVMRCAESSRLSIDELGEKINMPQLSGYFLASGKEKYTPHVRKIEKICQATEKSLGDFFAYMVEGKSEALLATNYPELLNGQDDLKFPTPEQLWNGVDGVAWHKGTTINAMAKTNDMSNLIASKRKNPDSTLRMPSIMSIVNLAQDNDITLGNMLGMIRGPIFPSTIITNRQKLDRPKKIKQACSISGIKSEKPKKIGRPKKEAAEKPALPLNQTQKRLRPTVYKPSGFLGDKQECHFNYHDIAARQERPLVPLSSKTVTASPACEDINYVPLLERKGSSLVPDSTSEANIKTLGAAISSYKNLLYKPPLAHETKLVFHQLDAGQASRESLQSVTTLAEKIDPELTANDMLTAFRDNNIIGHRIDNLCTQYCKGNVVAIAACATALHHGWVKGSQVSQALINENHFPFTHVQTIVQNRRPDYFDRNRPV